jgi:hypothetical protein
LQDCSVFPAAGDTRDYNACRIRQKLDNGQAAPLQILVDGTNSNTALIALGYVSQFVAQFQSEEMIKARPTSADAAQLRSPSGSVGCCIAMFFPTTAIRATTYVMLLMPPLAQDQKVRAHYGK